MILAPSVQQALGYACDLLRNSTLSVSKVAALCGFSDPAYFHRRFKGRFASTPLEYRNAGKKAPPSRRD